MCVTKLMDVLLMTDTNGRSFKFHFRRLTSSLKQSLHTFYELSSGNPLRKSMLIPK